jgi:hypothetical protein
MGWLAPEDGRSAADRKDCDPSYLHRALTNRSMSYRQHRSRPGRNGIIGSMGRSGKQISLAKRVEQAAEKAMAEQDYVSAIDVLIGVAWLTPKAVDVWRQGRVEDLEQLVQVPADRAFAAVDLFQVWAGARGLRPAETAYISRTPDRRPLRFSESGDPVREQAYRTHWLSPAMPEPEQRKLVEKQSKPPDLVVISPLKDWTCTECSGTGDLLIMDTPGPLCLACADLDHLAFLAAGDTALTRRAKKASGLSAVVVLFSRSRKRYERQGLLVEESALAQAEQECLADEDARQRQRLRNEKHRSEQDVAFQASLAREMRRLFPSCPPERTEAIAQHAGTRSSGRVGRSAAGRALDPEAITLAVVASVRHEDTPYDQLLMSGVPREEARQRIQEQVRTILDDWRTARF